MKKTVMPAILFGTMLIGMFVATIPVYEASTVHTTVQNRVEQTRNVCATVPHDSPNSNNRTAITTNETELMDGVALIIVNGTAASTTRSASIVAGSQVGLTGAITSPTNVVQIFGDESVSRIENGTISNAAKLFYRTNLTTVAGLTPNSTGLVSIFCVTTEEG